MAHGHPDYGLEAPTKTIHTVTDLGELAARLSSIDTFDRRGDVVWLDDFESGLQKWELLGVGAGWSTTWSPDEARNGGFSAKLLTGPVAGRTVYMNHYQPYPVLSRMGFEFSFSRGVAWRELWLRIALYDGTYQHEAVIRWKFADSSFYYQDSGGVDVKLTPPLGIWVNVRLFNTLKLVVDFVKEEYFELIVNSQIFPLAGIKYEKTTPFPTKELIMQVGLETEVNLQALMHVEDAIITQNEPE